MGRCLFGRLNTEAPLLGPITTLVQNPAAMPTHLAGDIRSQYLLYLNHTILALPRPGRAQLGYTIREMCREYPYFNAIVLKAALSLV